MNLSLRPSHLLFVVASPRALYGVVWCSTVRYGTVRESFVVRCCVVQYGTVRYGTVRESFVVRCCVVLMTYCHRKTKHHTLLRCTVPFTATFYSCIACICLLLRHYDEM